MNGRQQGKSHAAFLAMKALIGRGGKGAYITLDQKKTIAEIQRQEPGTLCEVAGEHYVIPHFRKSK